MENNEKRFENYFTGLMSSQEVEQFNKELSTNPDFNNEYQYFLSVKKSTAGIARDNFRDQLQHVTISSINTSSKSSSNNPLSKMIKWGIIILSILLLSYFTYRYFNSNSPQAIYASNFELYESQTSRGGSAEEITSLYNNGKYAEFISRAEEQEINPEIYMMLANANMKLGAFDKAEEYLLKIPEESSLRELKYWNLGLVSLKLDHLAQAKNHFRYLSSISNFKKKEIESILSKLNK